MSNSTEIEKRNHHHQHHHHSSHSEDEDESLSLSDLPLLSSSTRHQEEENGERLEFVKQSEGKSTNEDFDFGSLAASLDALESEMCIADEVFYRGQILPFRHSVSSACTTAIPCNLTRSESMDRIVGTGFRSSSTASTSRSSSTRSSSINSSASADKFSQRQSNYITNSNHHHHHKRSSKVVQNQFQSSRNPRTYSGSTSAPRRSTSSAQSPIKKSALWEIFRLGLVQTPEIELEDLKFRYGKHHGKSRGGSDALISGNGKGAGRSSSSNGKSVTKQSSAEESENAKIMKMSKKRGGMKLMKSCKCSVEAVEPVVAGRVIVGKEEEERKRKQDVTRHHRTFEWLRDLSHAVVLNDV